MPGFQHQFQQAARQAPFALDGLVGVGGRADIDGRRLVARPAQFRAQGLDGVGLGHQPGFEIQAGRIAQVGMGGTGVAVNAAVLAATVGIDRHVEGDVGESLRDSILRAASAVTWVLGAAGSRRWSGTMGMMGAIREDRPEAAGVAASSLPGKPAARSVRLDEASEEKSGTGSTKSAGSPEADQPSSTCTRSSDWKRCRTLVTAPRPRKAAGRQPGTQNRREKNDRCLP